MHETSAPPERAAASKTPVAREAVQRWRLVFARDPLPSSQAQRDLLAAWDAALISSGLPIAGLDAPRARPRFVLAAPLSAAMGGEAELADLWLVERLPRWHVREALAARLPAGHRLVDVYDAWLGEPPLPGQVAASAYRATLAGPADAPGMARVADELLRAQTLPRERRKGDGTVAYDLRPFLAALEVRPLGPGGAEVRMTLRHDPARGVGRPEEVLAALREPLRVEGTQETPLAQAQVVREALVLAAAPQPEPAAPRGPRRPPVPRSSPARPDRGSG